MNVCNARNASTLNKMVTVCFTTIPCESNSANMHEESHFLWGGGGGFIPVLINNIEYGSFRVVRIFLCI